MKQHTLKDLENAPDTLIKFFLLQGKAEPSMLEDALEFYKTVSVSAWKSQRKNRKNFIKYFLRTMKFFNSIKR